ncbi:MAG TPA: EfeM/EfeO family lipoprotein [Pseudolabrys sp.]|nr:EfeM/EfeO family lipoprotein [Pseudolabrys sp.]
MSTMIETLRRGIGARLAAQAAHAGRLCCALLAFAVVAGASGRADADAMSKGVQNYKPYAVEHIGIALAGAKEMQTALKAGDAKAAQAAWIKSRKGWEAAEPITGEFFPKLDEAIDAWPDAKQGYHAIEAALFAGKLDDLAAPVDKLTADLTEFNKQLSAKSFHFTAQGLLNGATKLAYEVGENKSKGGESPYAGTSLTDMHENVEGIEAVYKLAFHDALKARDPKLAASIIDKIEDVEKLVEVKDLKTVDQPALKKAGEELAVLLQTSAGKLKLKKPTVGE